MGYIGHLNKAGAPLYLSDILTSGLSTSPVEYLISWNVLATGKFFALLRSYL